MNTATKTFATLLCMLLTGLSMSVAFSIAKAQAEDVWWPSKWGAKDRMGDLALISRTPG